MRMRGAFFVTEAFFLIVAIGCGSVVPVEPKGYREKIGAAVKLTGELVVDGAAPQGISVMVIDETKIPVYKQQKGLEGLTTGGTVKPDGQFQFTTFDYGDGLPVGSYVLLFKNNGSSSDPKIEAFNKKYGDPETSKYKAKLEAGNPVDLGKVELSSK